MGVVKRAESKPRLSELVDRADAGDSVEITTRNNPMATLKPIEGSKKPIDGSSLQSLTFGLSQHTIGAADFIRSMRDGDGY